MEAFFEVTPEIPKAANLWRDAAGLAWRLDRAGKILPLTDITTAACAMRVDAMVISPDTHFSQIEGLRWRQDLPA